MWFTRLAAIALGILCSGSVLADGLILIGDLPAHAVVPGHFRFAPLEVQKHNVDVSINGMLATTSVEQDFRNPSSARLEGTYIFPLPEGAHIDKFSMDVNGVQTEAELLSAEKARALYEEIVRKMRDPALLEYAGRGAFKVRIFPIEPNSVKHIKIAYTQLLKSDFGTIDYTYPLNTEKFSSAPIGEVSVKVRIDGAEPLKSVYSPSHNVSVLRDGAKAASFSYSERNARPDRDFKLVFSRAKGDIALNILTSRKEGEDGYFMLLASPGVLPQGAVMPKDICFVLDSSGSMAQDRKLEQAKKALAFCLANLNSDDRFEIIRFSTESESLFNGFAPAVKANLEKASGFLAGIKPNGGTAIDEAMQSALKMPRDGKRPCVVIFLTDGLPTVGETREEELVGKVGKSASNARIFSFGIGSDVNTHLLDRISSGTKASSQYVLPQEDIEVKVSNFYSKIKDPALSNLHLDLEGSSVKLKQLYPNPLPDLFSGDMVAIFGRYSGSGPATLTLSGSRDGKSCEFKGHAEFSEGSASNAFIPQLWATRRVGWLLDEIRLHGESKELKDEVASLARQFGIVTPYTSYLIMEDERRREVPAALRNLQELERDKAASAAVSSRMISLERESKDEKARSGSGAVDNAMAINNMATYGNILFVDGHVQGDLAKKAVPAASMADASQKGYRASQQRNYAQQARVVNGRSFFQNGNVWTDSNAQSLAKGTKTQQLAFNSDGYFELLKAHPEIAAWLSLGNELDIVVEGVLYQIRDV